MSIFMPPIGAVGASPANSLFPVQQKNDGQADVSKFSSVFLQGMLKEIFKNQWKNAFLDDNIDNSLYADMLTEEMIKQLAENDTFGLNSLIEESIGKKRGETVQNKAEL